MNGEEKVGIKSKCFDKGLKIDDAPAVFIKSIKTIDRPVLL